MVCKMGCASARTGTHAGIAIVPRTVATLAGCPVRVSHKDTTNKKAQGEMPCAFCWSGLRDSPGALLRAPARTRVPQQSPGLLLSWRIALFESLNNCRTKKARQKALLFLLERITRLARCASARTGTHAGIATVPRTVATLTGCPVRVLRKDTTNKKAQGEMPCAFCWSGLRDSNSLPPPWQGGALPDELNPQTIVLLYPAGAGLSSPFLPMGIKSAALLWA